MPDLDKAVQDNFTDCGKEKKRTEERMGKEKDGEVEIYTFFLFVVYFTPR
jgi:hypothetical protein